MDTASTNIIIVIATCVIAIFSGLSWWTSHRIHQETLRHGREFKEDSIKRDKEIERLFITLSAAIMSAARPSSEAPISGRLFKEHLDELIKKLKDFPAI